jgi:hypothetical protein
MYFKSIIGAIFTSLAVMSFSANAALISIELNTDSNGPLLITAPNNSPTAQQGQMTGFQLGYQWTLEYTSPLNYTLTNTNGFSSQGIYSSFVITPTSLTESTSVGIFTDNVDGVIATVSSTGTFIGSYSQTVPIEWEGKGVFTFTEDASRRIDVPVPATMFLFAPALLGLFALRRKAKNTVA